MKGLVFLGDKKLSLSDFEDPSPGVGEVVLEIKASGMCGSDLHPYRAAHDPNLPWERRMIGGHEPCGEVAAVGRACRPMSPKSVTVSCATTTKAARLAHIAATAGHSCANLPRAHATA